MDENVVTNDQSADSTVTNDLKTSTRAVKLRIGDIEWLLQSAENGSPAEGLSRRRTEYTTLLEYQEVVGGLNAEISALKQHITGLEADIEHLIDEGASTALTAPSEQSQLDFGGDVLKDVVDAVKDACADEGTCVKTALHLIDTQANLVDSQSSREHDRNERDKDRKLKQDLADGKAKHEKDLALIKKGHVREADLEGMVFLGEHRHKSAKAAIEDRKEQARRESEADEEWVEPDGDVL